MLSWRGKEILCQNGSDKAQFFIDRHRGEGMGQESRVAVFVDTENLAHWIKHGGLEVLLEELSSIGAVVVRKAYARWSRSNMEIHQATLNRHGFELIHTFHPVSGKNSADIQIAVDVMEYALRDDLACIALATGDSDFSPLFRRLREMGKQVFGIGPRSALSESVKSSCSRFIYTETETKTTQNEAARASAFDDASDLLEKALKTFDGPANCSALKSLMLNIDSAFDEKSLGFKNFNAFVKAVDNVELIQEDKSWFAHYPEIGINPELPHEPSQKSQFDSAVVDITETYRKILRKKHWRSIPAPVLRQCYKEILNIGMAPKSVLLETIVMRCNNDVTTTDANKAISLLFKADLVHASKTDIDGEVLWQISPLSENEMLNAVDLAMLVRLVAGLEEQNIDLERDHLAPLFLSKHNHNELDVMLEAANRLSRKGGNQD